MLKKPNRKITEMDTTKKFSVEEDVEEVEEVIEDTEAEDMEDEIDDAEDSEETEEAEDYSDDESDEDLEEEAEEDDEEEEIEDEETDEMDDLYTVKKEKRKSKLEEGEYIGLLTEVSAERKLTGKYGKPWVNIGLKFKIKNPDTGEHVEVTFNANKSLDSKSRLYPIVKGILGAEPGDNFNLKELEGKKAKVSIEHSTDSEGNVWDNIVAVRKYIPKKK
ncbi:hypothetical protein [Clostridium scatologenes]|uniref:Uncharacterized protein n=1 Tax=Clostridium scatologenes TaxID=1548 RepID=A0A0E3GRT2_CLOSL|nr:hypothetical protein [Clostridium scatologenes]AKA70866.1 hypothetical protein CSCA_3741 [Clostridium scatologenes]